MAVSSSSTSISSISYPFLSFPNRSRLLSHRRASSAAQLPSSSSSGLYHCALQMRPTYAITAASGVDTARDKPEVKVEREPMVPPYNVLITGSTKGIGYALAKEFLKAGDNVIICSRSAQRVEETVSSLRNEFGEQRVWGTKCDVRNGQDVKNLVAYAHEKLKYIDIWINNAGSNAYSYKPLSETSDEDLIEVVTTNTLGLMICCREIQTFESHLEVTFSGNEDDKPASWWSYFQY